MMIKFLLISSLLVSVVYARAQSGVQSLYADKIEYSCDTSFTVSLRSTKLRRAIAVQGTLKWDTTAVQYAGIFGGTSAVALNESNMNLSGITDGYLTFLWFDFNLTGIDMPDDSALFSIRFRRNGPGAGRGDVSFSNTPTPMEVDTLDVSGSPQKNNDIVYTSGYIVTPDIYVFNGAGSWGDASNWTRGRKPPATLPECSEVWVDPAGDAECVMNSPFTVLPGARMQVIGNKRLRVNGNLILQ
jgi:hypothetical protein